MKNKDCVILQIKRKGDKFEYTLSKSVANEDTCLVDPKDLAEALPNDCGLADKEEVSLPELVLALQKNK